MNVRASTLIAIAVTGLLAVGLYAAWRLGRPAGPASVAAGRAMPDTSRDAVVDQALSQIPAVVDSAAIKTGWRDDVRGIDLDAMTTRQRELMLRHANTQMCTCGCGFTLAACRTYDLTCPVSLPRVEALRDSILAGHIRGADGLRQPPGAAHP